MSKYRVKEALNQLYTLFCIKIKNKKIFFSNPGTIGTIQKSVTYQWLIAQICTKSAWYNEVQLVQKYQKASNTNKIRGRAYNFLFYLFAIEKRVHRIL